ncbi:MAG TPA: redoxin domain-containing protein [Terriglobales bacterium]|nr:redoxin domain-containing protein [Terriglobales bacterium]
MKQMLLALLLAGAVFSAPLSGAAGSNDTRNNKETAAMPKVGDLAPDFKMQYFDGHDLKTVTLDQYRGKQQVVLAFYVFAFTGG